MLLFQVRTVQTVVVLNHQGSISTIYSNYTRYDPSKSSSAAAMDCDSSACAVCQPVDLTGTSLSLSTRNSQSDCTFGNPFCYNAIEGESLCGYGITYGGGSSA